MSSPIYLYDGSFHGFLCCIFESYVNREIPEDILPENVCESVLFETRLIGTDFAHAGRVLRKVAALSPYALNLLQRGFLTCLEGRELLLYRLTARLLRDGPGFLRNSGDEDLYPVFRAVRHLNHEAQLLRGFVRFSELGGVLGAEIEPKNKVLPLLRGHFCSRYRNESLFIYDRTHREILLYAGGKAVIAPLEHFQMAPPDEREAGYRLLWKRFYETIAIADRYNPRCRMTQMPKRYWNTMTEFQQPEFFRANTSHADVSILSSPTAIPAPEKLSEFALSDPESAP